MAHIQINEAHFATLKDKVVVLTGGANGIGRAAVRLFHQHGAKILFGDINTTLGLALESELSSTSAKFISTDVTSYTSQLHLFKTAISLYGKIDVVVANAGVSIPKDPFEFDDVDGDGEEEIEREFPTTEIDVNLKGCLYTTRIGMFYLRRNRNKSLSRHNQNHNQNGVSVGEVVGEGEGGDLILVSSIAGFKESTGLAVYTASKHGVLGLLRGVRVQASREGVRVNAVCPWMTKTAMVAGIETGWRELSLPENGPEDVAKSILICATANRRLPNTILSASSTIPRNILGNGKVEVNGKNSTSASSTDEAEIEEEGEGKVPTTHPGAVLPFAGKVVFVAGGESYEIEDGINELEPRWLGRGNSEALERGQEFLMREGTSWDTEKGKGR